MSRSPIAGLHREEVHIIYVGQGSVKTILFGTEPDSAGGNGSHGDLPAGSSAFRALTAE